MDIWLIIMGYLAAGFLYFLPVKILFAFNFSQIFILRLIYHNNVEKNRITKNVDEIKYFLGYLKCCCNYLLEVKGEYIPIGLRDSK